MGRDKAKGSSKNTRLKEVQDEALKNIHLAPDLTKMQQEDDNKLRDKVKEFRDKGKKCQNNKGRNRE